jgi:hypothetical protein
MTASLAQVGSRFAATCDLQERTRATASRAAAWSMHGQLPRLDPSQTGGLAAQRSD